MDHKKQNSLQSNVLQQKNNSFFQSQGSGTFFGVTQQKSFFGNARQAKMGDAPQKESSDSAEGLTQLKSTGKGSGASGADANNGGSSNSPLVPFQFKKSKSGGSLGDGLGGGGRSDRLPPLVQLKMKGALGSDFSDVNIHQNSSKATKMGALAFTQGKDVHFAPGQYKPGSSDGESLIAHELKHVQQQKEGRVKATDTAADGSPLNADPMLEKEADDSGAKAANFKLSPKTMADAGGSDSGSGDNHGGSVQMKPVQMKPAVEGEPMPDEDYDDTGAYDPGGKKGKGSASGDAGKPSDNGNSGNGDSGGSTPPAGDETGDAKGGSKKSSGAKKSKGDGASGADGGGDTGGASTGKSDKKGATKGGKTSGKSSGGGATSTKGAAPSTDGGSKTSDEGAGSSENVSSEGGGGQIAEYLRNLSESAFQAGQSKISKLAAAQKKVDPAKKKASDSQKAAKAPAKEGQSKANAKRVKNVEKKPKPKTNKEKAKSDFRSKLESNMPKKVKHVLDFKKSKKAKKMGKAAMDAIAVDKNKITGTYAEMKSTPSAQSNSSSTPIPSLEKAAETPKMDLGKDMIGELKPEHTDFSNYKNDADDQLKKEGVTDEHLNLVDSGPLADAKKNREEIGKTAEKAPEEVNKMRQEKTQELDQKLQEEEKKGRDEMNAERTNELNNARDKQTKAKTKFEQERDKVTKHINDLYEGARKKVEQKLGDLEQKAFRDFEKGQEKATKKFEDNVDREMKALKKKRYKGLKGKWRWAKDKILGIGRVTEVKDLIKRNREAYINEIDKLVESITQRNEQVINDCRQTIEDARKKIDEYVDGLPDQLKSVGEAAEDDIQKKLDELDTKISQKEQELKDKLALKREEAIEAIDKKIAELKKKMGGLLSKFLNFILEAALKFLRWALKTAGLDAEPFIDTVRKFANAVIKIIKNPIQFLKNLIKAVGGGFKEFGKNAGQHLKEGAMTWLQDKIGLEGFKMPEKFNLKGILQMVLSMLGISWTNIKSMFGKAMGDSQFIDKISNGVSLVKTVMENGPASLKSMGEDKVKEKMEEKLGADRMDQIMMVVDLVKSVAKEGPKAIWGWIQEKGSDLKAMAMEQVDGIKTKVMDGIKGWIKKKLIEEGIKKLLGFLTPAGGVVSAIISIYQSVKFFIENKSGLKQLFSTIISGIGMVINGDVGGAMGMIKDALVMAIPLLLSFISKLLNLDGIFTAIKNVVGKVTSAINGFLEKVIGFVAKIIKKVWDKIKGWFEKIKDKITGKDKDDEGPKYDDPEKEKAVSEGLDDLDEEASKYADDGKIKLENAEKAAEKVQTDNQLFKSITVVDGGDSWDYIYVCSPPQRKTGHKKLEEDVHVPEYDALTKEIYEVKSGDGLEKVIKAKYKDYPYQTGNDRRHIAQGIAIINEGNKAIYYTPDKESSWSEWFKDVFDPGMKEVREVYRTVGLREGMQIKLPTTQYIDFLREEGKIGGRADWKNKSIEVGRGIQGFNDGVSIGFGQAAVDTVKDLWGLVKGIFTGEIFKQAYEFFKQLKNMSWDKLAGMVGSLLGDAWTAIVKAWNNPNPYDKWQSFGKIIGMMLFEIALSILSSGVGTALKAGTKIAKVLDDIPALGKIIRGNGGKLDNIDPKKREDILKKQKRDKDNDNDTDKDDKTKENKQQELPKAIMAAKALVEANKANDASAVIIMLNTTIKPLYGKWLKGFGMEFDMLGNVDIYMYASKHEIKNDFSKKYNRLKLKTLKPGSKEHKYVRWIDYQIKKGKKPNEVVEKIDDKWSKQYDTIISNKKAGSAFENSSLGKLGYKKNNAVLMDPKGDKGFIPDAIKGNPDPKDVKWGDPLELVEVKGWQNMSYTGNLAKQIEYVKKFGGKITVVFRSAADPKGATKITGPLKTALDALTKQGKAEIVRLP